MFLKASSMRNLRVRVGFRSCSRSPQRPASQATRRIANRPPDHKGTALRPLTRSCEAGVSERQTFFYLLKDRPLSPAEVRRIEGDGAAIAGARESLDMMLQPGRNNGVPDRRDIG